MLNDLYLWLALFGILVVSVGRSRAGVLTLGYFGALSIAHVPGILAYLGDSSFHLFPEQTELGFEVTLYALSVFVAGVLASLAVGRGLAQDLYEARTAILQPSDFDKLSWRLLLIGLGMYFLALPVVRFIPSLTSLASGLGTLLIPAFWLRLQSSILEKSRKKALLSYFMLPLLPALTLVTSGFLGYGVLWVVTIMGFSFALARRRFWFYVAAAPAVIFALSLFVTYMQQRDDLRRSIAQDSSYSDRIDRVAQMVTGMQLIDTTNPQHQNALAIRLNQNFLVGLAVQRHEAGILPLYYGATVPLWVLIPRAIWPDKPAVGGSGTLSSEVTGLTFAEGTSVGIGNVAEWYVNFGFYGLMVGMFGLGALLMRLDQAIRRALFRRDIPALIACSLPGLALLQPLGSFMETLVSLVSGIVVAKLLSMSGVLELPQRVRLDRPENPVRTGRVPGR